jgi:hypothetical protein
MRGGDGVEGEARCDGADLEGDCNKLCCQGALTFLSPKGWATTESRSRRLNMGNTLCLVHAMVCGCTIYRETTGCYVVSHQKGPKKTIRVATLAGAYATCHGWNKLNRD